MAASSDERFDDENLSADQVKDKVVNQLCEQVRRLMHQHQLEIHRVFQAVLQGEAAHLPLQVSEAPPPLPGGIDEAVERPYAAPRRSALARSSTRDNMRDGPKTLNMAWQNDDEEQDQPLEGATAVVPGGSMNSHSQDDDDEMAINGRRSRGKSVRWGGDDDDDKDTGAAADPLDAVAAADPLAIDPEERRPSKLSVKVGVKSDIDGLKKSNLKKKQSAKRQSIFISDTKRMELFADQSMMEKAVSSKQFKSASVLLILVNALFIGVQTQYLAVQAVRRFDDHELVVIQEPTAFVVLSSLFSVLFLVELVMRWIAEGLLGFWQTTELWWNLLDLVVVVIGVVDFMLLITQTQTDSDQLSLATIRMLRVMRLARVARIVRMMKFFRELRMMITSIMNSFKSLVWVIVILAMMFSFFGIIFTDGVTSYLVQNSVILQEQSNATTAETGTREAIHRLVEHFGLLERSIISLYMSMSAGEDWGLYVETLRILPDGYRGVFIVFITFAIFAVFNIVTGVFVESAMQSSQLDREAVVQDELDAKKTYFKAMETLFEEMDEDDSGTITLEEFEGRLDDERVAAYFNSLKLDVSDAKMLFQLLDHDASEEISYAEFVMGFQRLQGEASSLDAKILGWEVKYVKQSLEHVVVQLDEMKELQTKTMTALEEAKPPPKKTQRMSRASTYAADSADLT